MGNDGCMSSLYLEGFLLKAHDSSQVALEPHPVADELRQLLIHQRLLLLE